MALRLGRAVLDRFRRTAVVPVAYFGSLTTRNVGSQFVESGASFPLLSSLQTNLAGARHPPGDAMGALGPLSCLPIHDLNAYFADAGCRTGEVTTSFAASGLTHSLPAPCPLADNDDGSASPFEPMLADSVRRKRKHKMNKHKHRCVIFCRVSGEVQRLNVS